MKRADVKSNTYIDSSKEINNKKPKFKIGDTVRMSKYKNIAIMQKVTVQIGLKEFLWLKKLKMLYPGQVLLMILMEKKLLERFTKTICKKTNQKEFRIGKVSINTYIV